MHLDLYTLFKQISHCCNIIGRCINFTIYYMCDPMKELL